MKIRKAVMEDEGRIAATAIINQLQVDVHNGAPLRKTQRQELYIKSLDIRR